MSRYGTSRTLAVALGGALLVAATIFAIAPLGAGAAPANAPGALAGTFSCDNGLSGTFVATGNNGRGTSWNVAHLTFADGGTGVFHPTAFDLMGSFDGQTFPEVTQKHNTSKGDVTCSISGRNDGFSLSGSVQGFITTTP